MKRKIWEKQFSEGRDASTPAVFQKDQNGGNEQGTCHGCREQDRGNIPFQERYFQELTPFRLIPVPPDRQKNGQNIGEAAQPDEAQA